jgi:hypothetical protein
MTVRTYFFASTVFSLFQHLGFCKICILFESFIPKIPTRHLFVSSPLAAPAAHNRGNQHPNEKSPFKGTTRQHRHVSHFIEGKMAGQSKVASLSPWGGAIAGATGAVLANAAVYPLDM